MQRVRLTADDLPYFCMTTKTCRSLWEDMESCKVILSDAKIMPSSDQGHGSSSHQTSSSFWQRIQCKLYIMCFVSLSCHLNKFLLQENPGWPSAGGPRMDRRAVTNLTLRFAPAALSSEGSQLVDNDHLEHQFCQVYYVLYHDHYHFVLIKDSMDGSRVGSKQARPVAADGHSTIIYISSAWQRIFQLWK